MEDIHQPRFVRGLFDRMARTYGTLNYLSSFGFTERWRRRCVDAIPWQNLAADARVYDLMSGMGECFNLVWRHGSRPLCGLDISPVMTGRARRKHATAMGDTLELLQENVLSNSIPDGAAAAVVSAFGLKHFSPVQARMLAAEVGRILKPGGAFSFVEVAVPQRRLLRVPFLFYLRRVVPLLGRYFANDDDSYRYLGVYTVAFGNGRAFARALRRVGLDVAYREYFFGCACGVVGRKPG